MTSLPSREPLILKKVRYPYPISHSAYLPPLPTSPFCDIYSHDAVCRPFFFTSYTVDGRETGKWKLANQQMLTLYRIWKSIDQQVLTLNRISDYNVAIGALEIRSKGISTISLGTYYQEAFNSLILTFLRVHIHVFIPCFFPFVA